MSAEEGTVAVEQPAGTPAPAATPVASPAPAPAEGGEGASKTSAPAAATMERDEQGRFRNPVQPRIDELTRGKREAEREAAYWRGVAEANKAPAPAAPKKPVASDFADYADYVEALTDFKAKEIVTSTLKERDTATQQREQQTKTATTWEGRQAEARKQFPDYDSVLTNSDVPIADHVGAALLESDFGPHIARHLALNPAVADKLNKMSPLKAAQEIGKLEAGMVPSAPSPAPTDAPAAPAAPAEQPRVARMTQAPPPAKTTTSAPATVPKLENLSMDDYVKTRKAQGARWAR